MAPVHKTHLYRRILPICASLAFALVAQAAPIISEFVADNETGYRDQDGEFEDWLELFNPEPTQENIGGYYLTDNPDNLRKWMIPPGTMLEPREFLVIVASGKDRRVVGQQLHTNFSLDREGEFLALVDPNGNIVHQWDAEQQFTDVSRGVEMVPVSEEDVLVDVDAACAIRVPLDGSLNTTWTQVAFDDNLWTAGTMGTGYERGEGYQDLIKQDVEQEAFNTNTSVYIRIPFTVEDVDDLIALSLDIQYDDGFVAYLNGSKVTSANAPTIPLWDSLATNKRTDEEALDFASFALNGQLNRLSEGDNVLAIHLLNSSADDENLLARLQLSAIRITDLTVGGPAWFPSPTAGSRNGVQEELPTSEVVFSHESHAFSRSFELSLSSTFESETIRYTLDRSEPNANSPVYTDPIRIRTSTQVRARVFSEDNAAGPVSMRTYLQLERDVRTFNSNLPIVILENWNRGDPPGTGGVDAFCAIIEPDPVTGRATITDELQTGTRCSLKRRGSSSFNWPKYSMTVEAQDEDGLDKGIRPLGLPRESDWVLSGRYQFDHALMRNDFIYELSRQTGEYAVRTRFVEVFNNVRGGPITYSNDYFGVYSLMEKIKRDDNRVPVARLDRRDSREPDVTGGYMFKKDRLDPGDSGFSVSGMGTLGWVEPKEREVTTAQRSWLVNHMNQINGAVSRADGINPTTGKHFTEYIDEFSWLRHHWLNTLAMNVDGFRLSGYYYKHRIDTNEGKLSAGPIWDFDRTMGSTDGRDDNPSQWDGTGDSSRTWNDGRYPWWGQALSKPDFRQAHTDLWFELRENVFSTANIEAVIDGFAAQIDHQDPVDLNPGLENSPAERNYRKWGVRNYPNEVANLKNWLRTRVRWIDRQYTAKPRFRSDSGLAQPGLVAVDDEFAFLGSGSFYYTTDGTDPRLPGGDPSPSATRATGNTNITIEDTMTITARARSGSGLTSWSAPTEASFLIGPIADASNLVITEVHYAPLPPTTAGELDVASDPWDFEFVELKNISTTDTINLTDVHFVEGIDFTFTRSDITSLAPGEFVLLVNNKAAFEARYGTDHSARIAGEYAPTRLENAGERLHLVDGLGETIANFRYNDKLPWPEPAGTTGVSMVLRASALPQPDYAVPENWGSSAHIGGTPNADEIISGFAGDPTADNDDDGYPRLIEHVLGTSDSDPTDTAGAIALAVQSLEVDGVTGNYLTITFLRSHEADDVTLIPQFSTNLIDWFHGGGFVPLVSEVDQGDGTSLMTYRAALPVADEQPKVFMRLGADLIPAGE